MSLSVAFLLALVFGALLGLGMRQVMGNRVRLGWSEAVLSGIVGSAIGALTISLIRGGYYREHWIGMLLASALGTLIVMLIVGYFTRQPHLSAAELVAAGESARVEFKSTARCNLHTGQRDDKIEMVISKTVAALANSGGGDLLIGVDDAGTALGLDDDLKFMKQPDLDRYELWLRDHLSKTLGSTASANVEVSFPVLDDKPVCHLRMLGASRPVFLSPGKGQPVQMWVRVGNSTRQLGIDEALSYAADHWGRRRLR
ncbi:MAG: ATP-binding protein [Candidatus Nanopelagicales bacterium]